MLRSGHQRLKKVGRLSAPHFPSISLRGERHAMRGALPRSPSQPGHAPGVQASVCPPQQTSGGVGCAQILPPPHWLSPGPATVQLLPVASLHSLLLPAPLPTLVLHGPDWPAAVQSAVVLHSVEPSAHKPRFRSWQLPGVGTQVPPWGHLEYPGPQGAEFVEHVPS